jgi:hypothetical protein
MERIVNREWWEKKAGAALPIVDEILAYIQALDLSFAVGYNLKYIQINKGGRNFVWFTPTPTKNRTKIGIKVGKTPKSEALKGRLEEAGLRVRYEEAGKGGRNYRVSLDNDKFAEHASSIKELISLGLQKIEWQAPSKHSRSAGAQPGQMRGRGA